MGGRKVTQKVVLMIKLFVREYVIITITYYTVLIHFYILDLLLERK
jgi:hypothetical protein